MPDLSPQQWRLFALLIKDLRMKEIANLMNLDKRTVDTYARIVYKKHGVSSRIGLILKVAGR